MRKITYNWEQGLGNSENSLFEQMRPIELIKSGGSNKIVIDDKWKA